MKGSLRKAPPELIALFDAAIAARPGVERRQMFGYPCAFLNGNMLAGLFEDQMMVRLSEADRARAASEIGAEPFAPGGRPMREYVVLPKAIVADKGKLGPWIERAIAHVEALPAKTPKKPKRGS
jgi:TfoX/Sxy family transcriptional regulator of competence genes